MSKRELEINQIVGSMTDAERRHWLTELHEWLKDKDEAAATAKKSTLTEREEAAAQGEIRNLLQIVRIQKRPVYGYEDDSVQYAAKAPYDRDKIGLSRFAGGAWAFFFGAPKPPQKLREEEKAELARALRMVVPTEILVAATQED